ncbi:hypothetical protein ACE38W_19105 [Chitinophaga sp. Hz27]|uniref:hypothetical protein n=1 Tax=Chitinophaga sp. Hz27 TaxID=3347169 RepID=UPI0035E36D1B
MKKTLSFALGSLILATTFYACTKNDAPGKPAPVEGSWKGETQVVKLALKGDLVITESPLGNGRTATNHTGRGTADSVLYAVDIRVGNYQPFAQGILKRLDTIKFEVPKGVGYTIGLAAIRKGSSEAGLFQTDSLGLTYFDSPIRSFTNFKMTKDTIGVSKLQQNFLDTLNYFSMAVGQFNKIVRKHAELDIYYGFYNGTAGDSLKSAIDINMRRLTYGFKFMPVNFSGGSLTVSYGNFAASKTIAAAQAGNIENLYSADELRYVESVYTGIPVTLQWNRPDGGTQDLGTRVFYPKRNVLNTVFISLPSNNSLPVKLNITEQTWRQDTIIVW